MLLDYHLHHALKRATALYISDASRFAMLFQGIDSAVVESWRAKVVAKPPTVRLMGTQGPSDVQHLWVVSQQGAQPLEAFLGSRRDLATFGGVETQRADVYSAARDPEMAMCLHVLARATIMAHHKNFLAGPYDSLQYEGFSGTTMEAEAIEEKLGLAVRIQNWSAIVSWSAPNPESPVSLAWGVRAADAGGGVAPITGV